MKKTIITWLLCSFSTFSFAQYCVKGKVVGYEGRIVLLAQNEAGTRDTLGNQLSRDGSFCFSGSVDHPLAAEMKTVNAEVNIPLFLENTSSCQVEVDVNHAQKYLVSGGGELQLLRNEFHQQELNWYHQCDSMRSVYEQIYDVKENYGRMQVRHALQRMNATYEQMEDDFLRKHDNLVSASLVANRWKPLMEQKRLHEKYALLGEHARQTIQGRWLKSLAEKTFNLVVGGTAPNLTMKTPEGKSLSLYDVKAKVKIVDFWASWCGPCRAENPNVKRIYEQYHSKGLEIVSVSLDVKQDAWVGAIKKDQLPWIHISDLKGWNSLATDVYEIHAIPRLFVLDAENKIIAEGLRGEKLEECVREALNK
jgi:thiol-disulfide isomerase/thioredoxin